MFVQDKTIHGTKRIGKRIIDEQEIWVMGWGQQKKNIQSEYINKCIKCSHHAKPYHLPEDGIFLA